MRSTHVYSLLLAPVVLGAMALSLTSASTGSVTVSAAVADSVDVQRLLAIGDAVYTDWCADCHGEAWDGGLAGSLSDGEWMYVTDELSVEQIVRIGIEDEGMPAWEGILSEEEIEAILLVIETRSSDAAGGR